MLKHRSFPSLAEVELFSEGALLLCPLRNEYTVNGNLPFTRPTAFSVALSGKLTFAQLAAAVRAASLNTVRLKALNNWVWVVEDSPKEGISLNTLAADVAAALGMGTAARDSYRIYPAHSGLAPVFVSLNSNNGGEYVLTWETDASGGIAPSRGGQYLATVAANTQLNPPSRAIYVGGDGDLVVHAQLDPSGTYATYKNVKAGTIIPVVADEIRAATTATHLRIEQK
jgi:hypothetical protein